MSNEQQNTREAAKRQAVKQFLDGNANASMLYDQAFRDGAASVDRIEIVPLDVILFCPKCKAQHIDKAEPDKCESCGHPESEHFGHKSDDPDDIGCYACGGITQNGCQYFVAWLNPPHKKHRCHECNHVWKPAMIQTNGVAAMEKGK